MKYLIHIVCVRSRKVTTTLHVKCVSGIITVHFTLHLIDTGQHRDTHALARFESTVCFSNPRPYVIEIFIK